MAITMYAVCKRKTRRKVNGKIVENYLGHVRNPAFGVIKNAQPWLFVEMRKVNGKKRQTGIRMCGRFRRGPSFCYSIIEVDECYNNQTVREKLRFSTKEKFMETRIDQERREYKENLANYAESLAW